MTKLEIGNQIIDYESFGVQEDPAIILVRGMGSQRIRWHPDLVDALTASGLRVITMDNRDMGGSSYFEQFEVPTIGEFMMRFAQGGSFEAPYELNDMADDIVALMDGLGIGKALVMGMSMGGYIGQVLAAKRPDRVLGLISFGSSHELPGMEKMPPEIMALMMAGPKGTDEASLVEYELDNCRAQCGAKYAIDDDHYRMILTEERRRGVSIGGDTRQIMAVLASGDRTDVCRSIRVPTLIVHGSADPLVPVAEARAMAGLIDGSEYLEVEGGGHDVSGAIVPEIAPTIVDFCRRVLAR